MEFAKGIIESIFTWPLRYVYKNGPRMFLFWEGISDESICYEMTRVDSSFWKSNDETASACSEIIERKSNAFIIAVYVIVFVYGMYTLLSLLLYRYFFLPHLSAAFLERVEGIHITMRNEPEPAGETDEAQGVSRAARVSG